MSNNMEEQLAKLEKIRIEKDAEIAKLQVQVEEANKCIEIYRNGLRAKTKDYEELLAASSKNHCDKVLSGIGQLAEQPAFPSPEELLTALKTCLKTSYVEVKALEKGKPVSWFFNKAKVVAVMPAVNKDDPKAVGCMVCFEGGLNPMFVGVEPGQLVSVLQE